MNDKKPKYMTKEIKIERQREIHSNHECANTKGLSEEIMNACNELDEQGYEVIDIKKIENNKREKNIMELELIIITAVRKNQQKIIEQE